MRVLTRLKSVLCAFTVAAGTLAVAAGPSAPVARADGAPAPEPAIYGLEVVKKTATVQNGQQLTVMCPGSLVPIGGGGEAKVDFTWYDSVSLTDSVPFWDSWGPSGWTASARSDGAFTLTVYAVCGAEPRGYEVASQYDEVIDNGGALTATCPEGKAVLGGGGRIRGAERPSMGKSYPATAAATAAPGQWTVSGYEFGQAQWRADAYVVCAFPLTGVTTNRYTATTRRHRRHHQPRLRHRRRADVPLRQAGHRRRRRRCSHRRQPGGEQARPGRRDRQDRRLVGPGDRQRIAAHRRHVRHLRLTRYPCHPAGPKVCVDFRQTGKRACVQL
ncbi:hypothetical protein SUDANB120_00006 [Streptomyces sp. enrichment culture]|uniref:hypothetical protein n=1 Tax=Streptomyces sp. enrichment culture TaxID=1795815 RepID=UPI003F5569B4